MIRRRRSVSLGFFPLFSVGFRGWVVVFSFCFLFLFSTLFRVLDLDLLQSWEREASFWVLSSSEVSVIKPWSRRVFFCVSCTSYWRGWWFLLRYITSLSFFGCGPSRPPQQRTRSVLVLCIFPKTFENESLKNFSTSIAVYNPSLISGFALRLHVRRDRQNITALFLLLFHKVTRSDLIEFSSKLCVCCNIYTRFICS